MLTIVLGQVVPAGAQDLAKSGQQIAPIPIDQLGAAATKQYQGNGLSVRAAADGARLRCVFQRLEGHATSDGLWLTSTAKDATGEQFRVVAAAVGRQRAELSTLNLQLSTLPHTGTLQMADNLARLIRPGLTEDYSVSQDGVRQDFVIAERPAGVGDLRVELRLSGAQAEAAAYGARLTLEGSRRALAYNRLRVQDAKGQQLTARLEVLSADRLAVRVTDASATYPVRIDPTFSDADWSALGSGMDYPVNALAVSGTNLYAGGQFTTAGGVTANSIAQ